MRAAQLSEYGDASLLSFTDQADQPVPVAGQVLVAVVAAACNPFDITVAEGRARSMAELTLPATLGGDCAGTVAALGEGVTGFEIGQAVYGQANALSGQGSFAEFTAVKASSLAVKPDSTDFVSAAALPLVSASAYQALVDHMQLQSGQRILIHGGAGGIGTMAIQLAKHFGAYVITTASTADTDYVKNLGADQVIDYKTEDFSELVSDLDAVYDVIGGETNRKSYGVLKTGGVLVSMVEPVDESQASKYGIIYTHQFTKVTTERLCAVSSLVDGGELGVSIDKLFSLDQAGEALAYLKNAHPRGKVVLNIA